MSEMLRKLSNEAYWWMMHVLNNGTVCASMKWPEGDNVTFSTAERTHSTDYMVASGRIASILTMKKKG